MKEGNFEQNHSLYWNRELQEGYLQEKKKTIQNFITCCIGRKTIHFLLKILLKKTIHFLLKINKSYLSYLIENKNKQKLWESVLEICKLYQLRSIIYDISTEDTLLSLQEAKDLTRKRTKFKTENVPGK